MHFRIIYHVLLTSVVTVNCTGVVSWCGEVKWFDRGLGGGGGQGAGGGQSKGSTVNLLMLL